jgi:hypothetical protein
MPGFKKREKVWIMKSGTLKNSEPGTKKLLNLPA